MIYRTNDFRRLRVQNNALIARQIDRFQNLIAFSVGRRGSVGKGGKNPNFSCRRGCIVVCKTSDYHLPTVCVRAKYTKIGTIGACNLKRGRGRGAPRCSIRNVLCREWDGKIEVRPYDWEDLRCARNIATLPFASLAAQTMDENPNIVLPYDYYSRLCRDKVVEYSQCCWNRPLRLQLRGLALNDARLF